MKNRIITIAFILTLVSIGCSQVDAPQLAEPGTISLRFSRIDEEAAGPPVLASPGSSELAQALAGADYAVVKVFRAGADAALEVTRGEAIPAPPATLDMSLTVIAENNKRVAVELFEGGNLVYFGVNENVDVVNGKNSHVSIVATQFEAGGMTHTPVLVGISDGWQLQWQAIDGADEYRIQESPFPDFSQISWEGTTSNTWLDVSANEVPAGDFYYRVSGENDYARSDYGAPHYVHIYGPPIVDGFVEDVVEGMRGDQVIVTIQGEDLDYPGTYAGVFGLTQTTLSASRTELEVEIVIPDRAFTDLVTVTNPIGSDDSEQAVFVQNIAYIMGNNALGDGVSAQWYKKEIDSYGEPLRFSHAVVIPSDFLSLFGDLQMFDVIVVGWDTGTGPLDWADGTANSVQLIRDSGAMVLGIGVGGAALFEALGLDIGLSSASGANQNDVYVFDKQNSIYNVPNAINVPLNRLVPVYSSDPYQLSIWADNVNPPPDVSFYARIAQASPYYPLIDQQFSSGAGPKTTCFLWGFHEAPDFLTAQGQQLTENVVVHLFETKVAQVVQ